jgi:hypothetical protein
MFDSPPPNTLSFRLDPWPDDYASALQIESGDLSENPPSVDTSVESDDWSRPVPCGLSSRPDPVVFIDGVQQIEARLVAEHDGHFVNAALVALAAGAFMSRPSLASVESVRVDRLCAVADKDFAVPPVVVPWGEGNLRYRPRNFPGAGYAAVAQAIDDARRALETDLAAEMARAGHPLVVLDGRLSLYPADGAAVVGYTKTLHTRYLPSPEWDLLPRLGPGERTPLFLIRQRTPLFSWYVRLALPRAADHPLAGIVRLETVASVSASEAMALASLTAGLLPSFASEPWRDPRAPQNLLPLASLEAALRRELGDRLHVRRAIGDYFHAASEPAA